MLTVIYIALVLFVLVVALKKKRNLSFLVIYLFSSLVYYFNAFEGEVFIGKIYRLGLLDSYLMDPLTYIVLIINLLLTSFFIFCESENNDYIEKKSKAGEQTVIRVFNFVMFVVSVYFMVINHVFTRSLYSKDLVTETSGDWATYYKYAASFLVVYILCEDGQKYSLFERGLSIVPIVTTFLMGNRSYLVISAIAILFNKIFKDCNNTGSGCLLSYLARNKNVIIIAIIGTVSVLLVKGITPYLFTGNFKEVGKLLSNPEYYKQVFYVSEPNTIMTNLDTIISSRYQVDKSTYISLWAYFLPFLTGMIQEILGFENFTKLYQRELYVDINNRASTYLGEAYANGGLIVLLVVVIMHLLFVIWFFKMYKKSTTNIGKTLFLLMGITGSFYIQRNSMSFQFTMYRDYIYVAFILFILTCVTSKDFKIKINL